MSTKSLSTMEFAPKESNPFHYLKYIDYLQKEGGEEDYIDGVSTLMVSIVNSQNIDLENVSLLVKTIQHCLSASGKLFVQKQQSQALDILEAARDLVSKSRSKDPLLEKLRTVLYNNISVYCLSIEDSSLGIKFLQNCLKKDSEANTNLTCIFYNNLASVYLAHASYEKAFQLTKKSIYLLEPEIFAEIQQRPKEILKEDPIFKKNLIILLIGYLNMGSILEAYQFRTNISEPSKEMYEMNPKDFYKNSYGLAKKYLGENHALTKRLYYCYSKSDLILFKGIPTEASDFERNTSPKQRLKNMLDSIEDEDPKHPKRKKSTRQGHFSHSYNAKSVHNNFQIRQNSMGKSKPQRQTVDSSVLSDGYESPEDYPAVHHIPSNRYQQNMYASVEGYFPKVMHRRPQSGSYRQHDIYAQPPYANSSPDQTQIFMQYMFQQQMKNLEDNFNRKIEELKNITKYYSMDNNNEPKTLDSKDDVKIKAIERDLELLKEKMFQMKTNKDVKQKAKANSNEDERETPVNIQRHPESSRGFHTNNFIAEAKIIPPSIITPYSEQNKGKDSEQSTKSSGESNPYFLSPNRMLPAQPLNTKIEDKNSFDQHNNTGLPGFDASPISKSEKFYEPKASPTKGPWVPGKYAYPQSRRFKLDLKKVENYQGPDEEIRDRDDEERPQGNVAPKAKDVAKDKTAQENSVMSEAKNPPVPKLVKQTEKVPLKRTNVEKTITVVAAGGNTTNATKEEEPPKKASNEEKGNTTITPKGEFNDDSKTMEEEKLGRSDTTDRSKSLNHGYKRNSLSIPTSLDYMDSPTGSQFSSTGLLKLPKHAIIRKRVFMENDAEFMLVCTASWTKEEKLFKLQLMGPEEKVESELELPYKDLRKILKHLEYKDVMPITFHIKQIKNFYTLVRYLLMPFTTIRTIEDGKKEIAIYPKPPSLLTNSIDDMPTIEFMGKQCVIIFTHVIRNTFRIVLTDPETVEDALRIDVDFDKTSFDYCFRKHGSVEAPLRTVETSVKLLAGYDEDADDDEIQEFREASKKLSSQGRLDEEELESFKVIHKDLVEDLGNTLKDMESYLMTLGIRKLSQLADEKEVKYCKLKYTNKMKRTTLHLVWDRPEKQVLEVKIKNFFETFAPHNTKVKVCGEAQFLYDSVWKHFALNYGQLEYLDKVAMCSLVSEVYTISCFEKELSKEEFDRYEVNPISFVPIEIGSYHRTFLGEKYKFPLTLALIGINGEPKGIKATIYNMNEVLEVGAFFHLNPQSWAIHESERKKKRSERVNTIAIVENYHLDKILKKCGWEILKNWLVLEKRPNRVDIVGIKIFKDIRHTEQLENVLNSDTILKYINEKDQVES